MPTANLPTTVFGLSPVFFLMILATLALLFILSTISIRFWSHRKLRPEDYKLLESQKRASEIIENAIRQAQRIVAGSQAEEENLSSTFKTEMEQIESAYQKAVDESFAALKSRMEQRILDSENSYSSYLKELESRMASQINQNQNHLETKTNAFFTEAQKLLQNFIKDLQSRTETQVDKEIGTAKKIVADYKRQRMEIIDENIVAILEKALNVVIAKKLTLGDQTELVYEALERAKKENIFA